jgi:hypothetical protein
MLTTSLIFIAIFLVTVSLIIVFDLEAAFWREIKSWMIRTAENVEKVTGQVVLGQKLFFKRSEDMIKQISKNYSKNIINNIWQETIVTRQISEDEMPEEVTNKVDTTEKDFTKELELKLT